MRNGAVADDMTHSGAVNDAQAMTHVVIELGETNLWVSLHRPGGEVSRPHLVTGGADGQFPASLRVTASGRWFWGARRRHADDEVLVTNILSRVDDPVPLIVGTSSVPAAYLVAQQVATLFRAVVRGPGHQLDLVHPVDLSEQGRDAVEHELRRRLPAGTPVAWVSRAAAAVTAVPEVAELTEGDVVGVLHVGGTTSEAAVWRHSAQGGDVGPAHVDRGHAGHALDDTLVAAVLPTRADGRVHGAVDVAHLRAECASAKVVLSSETAADVDVAGVPVRLVRGEIEELTRRLLARQLDTLAAVLALQPQGAPVRLVLLVGGGAQAPYLVEAASERFDVPVLSVPRVGHALPTSALPVPIHPAAVADQDEPQAAEDPALTGVVVPLAPRRPWSGGGSLPARLRRRSGATTVAVMPSVAVPATVVSRSAARQAHVLMPRPVHLGIAAAALVGLGAGVQTWGLASAGGATAVNAAASSVDPAGPFGSGVRAAQSAESATSGAGSGAAGLAFTPGGATYTIPPWLVGAAPTGATLGPGGPALSMVTAGGAKSPLSPTTSSPSSSTTTTTPTGSTSTSSGTSSSASSSPAAKATTPSGAASTPASGSGSTPAGAAGTAPAASNPPASNPPASSAPSNPPASSAPSNPPVSNSPASSAPSNPPVSNPPASTSTPQPAPEPNPAPAPAPDPAPAPAPDPAPAPAPAPATTPDPAPATTPADTGSGVQSPETGPSTGGSTDVGADAPGP